MEVLRIFYSRWDFAISNIYTTLHKKLGWKDIFYNAAQLHMLMLYICWFYYVQIKMKAVLQNKMYFDMSETPNSSWCYTIRQVPSAFVNGADFAGGNSLPQTNPSQFKMMFFKNIRRWLHVVCYIASCSDFHHTATQSEYFETCWGFTLIRASARIHVISCYSPETNRNLYHTDWIIEMLWQLSGGLGDPLSTFGILIILISLSL